MPFVPSNYSYGDYGQEVIISEVEEQASGEGTAKAPPIDAGTIIDAASSLLGLSSGERESVAAIEGKIAVAEKKAAHNAFPGAWYWDDRLIKLRSQLGAAQELAAEEKRAATFSEARDIGYTVGVFAIAIGVGALAINQIQKARLRQTEIERAREM